MIFRIVLGPFGGSRSWAGMLGALVLIVGLTVATQIGVTVLWLSLGLSATLIPQAARHNDHVHVQVR